MSIVIDLNSQQIFDRVVQHLAQQKHAATNVQGMCLYRAPKGRSCAVGCLIPNDQYESNFENTGVRALVGDGTLLFPNTNVELLVRLQEAHDLTNNANALCHILRNIASEFDLNDEKVDLITEWSRHYVE